MNDRVRRDPYLDLLRASGLAVVVLWHCVGTEITWRDDGPHATNLLEHVPGLWPATWALQVMPVFFVVGGCLHRRAWRPGYVAHRVRALLSVALPLVVGAALVGAVLAIAGDVPWAVGTVWFALGPSWFLAVYLLMVVLLPGWVRLDRALGRAGLPVLAGLAVAVDVVRFVGGRSWVGWLNLVFVWGFAHQAGFRYDRLLRARRGVSGLLVVGGVAGLLGLLALGYPGSLVGVPTDRWSNVCPPSVALVALTMVQLGSIRLAAPAARLLDRPAVRRVLTGAGRVSMPVFLLHLTGLLLAQAVGWVPVLAGAVTLLVLTARRSRPVPTVTDHPSPHPQPSATRNVRGGTAGTSSRTSRGRR